MSRALMGTTARLEETRLLSFPSCRHHSLPTASLLPRGRWTMKSWNGVFQESWSETRPPTPGILSSRGELFLSKGTSSSVKAVSARSFPNLVSRRSARGRGTPDPATPATSTSCGVGGTGHDHPPAPAIHWRLQQGRRRPADTYQWPRQGQACEAGFRRRWSRRCSDPSRSRSDSSGPVESSGRRCRQAISARQTQFPRRWMQQCCHVSRCLSTEHPRVPPQAEPQPQNPKFWPKLCLPLCHQAASLPRNSRNEAPGDAHDSSGAHPELLPPQS